MRGFGTRKGSVRPTVRCLNASSGDDERLLAQPQPSHERARQAEDEHKPGTALRESVVVMLGGKETLICRDGEIDGADGPARLFAIRRAASDQNAECSRGDIVDAQLSR